MNQLLKSFCNALRCGLSGNTIKISISIHRVLWFINSIRISLSKHHVLFFIEYKVPLYNLFVNHFFDFFLKKFGKSF